MVMTKMQTLHPTPTAPKAPLASAPSMYPSLQGSSHEITIDFEAAQRELAAERKLKLDHASNLANDALL